MGSGPPTPELRRPRPGAAPLVGAVLALGVLGGCGGGVLEPKGSDADRTAQLSIGLIVAGTFVFLLVTVLLAVALFNKTERDHSRRLIIGGGIALPAVVLTTITGFSVWAGEELTSASDDPLVIEITGHQFWWDVRYPDHDVRTANEVHLPVGEPVELRLTSADVIHSFWVPQLAGKRDLIPGRVVSHTVQIDEAGGLQGYCAEFCGIQHANMRIDAVGHEPDDFDAWIAEQQEPAVVFTDGPLLEGQEAFLGSACVYCHRVDGTNATSEFGPDLTHLMSRESIAAGTLPLNRGELAGWLLDPQLHKPGNQMPPTRLDPDQLLAILDYLETLE